MIGWAERAFYYPSRRAFQTPRGYTDVRFQSDGLTLHGWFMPAAEAGAPPAGGPSGERTTVGSCAAVEPGVPRPVVVYCHGNAGNLARHDAFFGFLAREGVHAFAFDYRGYGRSSRGPINREGLIRDTRAAIDAAVSWPGVDPRRVGLMGMSLGGTIALAAAAEDRRVGAVVSVATFCRWKTVAGDYLGPLGRWLIPPGRDGVDSVGALGDRPLLIVHGTRDGVVAPYHGAMLAEAAARAGVPIETAWIDGAGHVDWVRPGTGATEKIGAFFRACLGR